MASPAPRPRGWSPISAVDVEGSPARASRLLARGERVAVRFPEHEPPRTLQPAAIPLALVFEDEHLAVIDKPAGLVVHPAPGHWDDTLVNALVARGTTLSGGAEGRPGIVHRLDRDTSGLMVVAKTDLAHRRLGAAIAARRVRRELCRAGVGPSRREPDRDRGAARAAPADRKRMAVIPAGRAARTDAYVVGPVRRGRPAPAGAPHRAHPPDPGASGAHRPPGRGRPRLRGGGSRRISGAPRRAAEALERATPRQALHAAALAFRHPVSGEPLEFRSEWPADLRPALLALGAEDLVARPDPLGYLLFFNRDG